jgi:hypothetical protein
MVMADDRRRPITELVFLDRGPLLVRGLLIVISAAAVGFAGNMLYRAEASLAASLAHGEQLNALQSLLAHGSSLRTAWIGWLAALFFAIAAMRVRRSPPEPTLGRTPPEHLTASQLRTGLRREYAVVRVLLVLLVLFTAVDAARMLTLAAATSGHGASLMSAVIEVVGLGAACFALALWAWWFGDLVVRLGALPHPDRQKRRSTT